MRLAFVTESDPYDPHAFSGLSLQIWKSLCASGAEVELFGNLFSIWRIPAQLRALLFRKFLGRPFLSSRTPLMLKSYASALRRRLAGKSFDGIVSPGTLCLAFLNESRPMAFWTDATFASIARLYPDYQHLHPASARRGNAIDRSAYARSAACVFSSDWAAASARTDYQVPAHKVHTVPFGPNLESGLEPGEIDRHIRERLTESVNILFLGMDWERKGGEYAVEVTRLLCEAGVRAQLSIVGCTPRISGDANRFCIVRGFINKSTEAGRAQLREIFLRSHVLLLPSKYDCCPVAFAEASAFGIPSIGFETGGSRTVVRDSINGQLFSPDTGAAEVAEYIRRVMSSPATYQQLSWRSYQEHQARLNWKVAGETVLTILKEAFAR